MWLDLMKQIDKMAAEYLGNCRNMVPHKRTDHLDTIQKMFTKSKEFGDDKVQLAMQTYELVSFEVVVAKGAGRRSSEVERSLMIRWVVRSILHGVDPLSYFSFIYNIFQFLMI